MRDKAYLKISVSIAISEALLELPEYRNKSITRIIAELTDAKLSNKNSNENIEKQHDSTIN